MLSLEITKRTEPRLLAAMAIHYSQPKGFVGRNICYAITHKNIYYGAIVGGSATRFLPGRDEFFDIPAAQKMHLLKHLVNNIFYHIEPGAGYPLRNFTTRVLTLFRQTVEVDWLAKYGDVVGGFESLVEFPRTGETYKRDGWVEVGQTKGFTCKRVAGKGTDNWSGKRVWNTDPSQLRPKRVFVRGI